MIGIIDYGLGNINAFANIYKRIGVPFDIIKNPNDLANVTHIILPGVGSFDYCMKKLEGSNFIDALNVQVLQNKKYILGICVGMQILANSSEEGVLSGLGWIDAKVEKFANNNDCSQKLRVPHIGWNTVSGETSSNLFGKLKKERFYFLHSYHFVPQRDKNIGARSWYGREIISAVEQQNIFGVQFHPEKSHDSGLKLLNNFARL